MPARVREESHAGIGLPVVCSKNSGIAANSRLAVRPSSPLAVLPGRRRLCPLQRVTEAVVDVLVRLFKGQDHECQNRRLPRIAEVLAISYCGLGNARITNSHSVLP